MDGASILTQRVFNLIREDVNDDQDFADLVIRSLAYYAGTHSWRGVGFALDHYMENRAEFRVDLTLWEARSRGPTRRHWQCTTCGMGVGGEEHDCPML